MTKIAGYEPQTGRHGYVVLNRDDIGIDQYVLVRECMLCGKAAEVVVPAQGLWNWEHGEFIQVAMPEISADEREVVLSGTHSTCWNNAFVPEGQA